MTRRDYLTAAVLIAIATLLALPTLTYPLVPDHGEFSVIANGILEGRTPYVELWNPKPPAVFYVFSMIIWFFGNSATALRAIDLLMFPVIAVTFYAIAMRLANRRVAIISVFALAAFYFTDTFWALTQSDGIALVPMTLATYFALKTTDDDPRSWKWAFLTGVFSAFVLWFKYPFVFFVVALVAGYSINHAKHEHPRARSKRLKDALAFCAGALLIGLGGIAYLHSIGALGALFESATATTGYARQGYSLTTFVDSPIWQNEIRSHWIRWRPLLFLLLVWPPLRFLVTRKSEPSNSGWPTIWLWGLAGIAILLVQAKGYNYQWLPMLPPLVLIAADSFNRLSLVLWQLVKSKLARQSIVLSRGRYRWMAGTHLAVIVGLLAFMLIDIWLPAWPFISNQETQAEYFSNFTGGGYSADESVAMVDYLKEHVAPGDSLYIWGFRPEIYFMSGLNPGSRFFFNFPLASNWAPARWRQENVDILWASLPPYVLVDQFDKAPWVTGSQKDSNALLLDYDEMYQWLIFNYEQETQIGDILVWQRKLVQ